MSIIARSKAWEFEFRLTHRKDTNGKEIPLTGQTVRAWLSETFGGEAITTADVLTLTEREERPGCYFGVLSQALLAAELDSASAVEGTTVYEVCDRNGERDSRALTVTLISTMQPATGR
jgi:hypothetical protein